MHNVVGLLHATMGIYYAYIDRAPVFIIGATGPMDEGKRRPRVDWEHTANVQGTQVRDYVKWDYQPGGIQGVADSFARAYSIMMTEPQGPIYMCYDAAHAGGAARRSPSSPADPEDGEGAEHASRPDPTALEEAADRLVAADWPVLLPQYRRPRSRAAWPTWSRWPRRWARRWSIRMWRLNFPTEHPLDLRHEQGGRSSKPT